MRVGRLAREHHLIISSAIEALDWCGWRDTLTGTDLAAALAHVRDLLNEWIVKRETVRSFSRLGSTGHDRHLVFDLREQVWLVLDRAVANGNGLLRGRDRSPCYAVPDPHVHRPGTAGGAPSAVCALIPVVRCRLSSVSTVDE
ncbi:hypothetical protein [Allokutzneria oryzae]|uniref:Uncharacterized protein n=1 Tax=Allokutzneria oryzae TaxID=1378989 RepID=A0ABV5ZTG3_9PSEU